MYHDATVLSSEHDLMRVAEQAILVRFSFNFGDI